MAGTKVTLRTALNDQFIVGDIVIDQQGTEIGSRAKADEIMEAARRSGVTLYEVEPADKTAASKTEEGDK